MLRRLTSAPVIGALVALAPAAQAENPRVNTQVFRPSPHAYDLLSTATSDMAEPWDLAAGLWLTYARDPLVFVDLTTDERHEVVGEQLGCTATAAVSFTEWLSLGLAVPFFALIDGDDAGFVPLDPVPSAALGDLRLAAKVGIIRRDIGADGLGFGLELPVSLPTGDGDAFVSDGLSITPTLVLDLQVGPLLVAANVGARIREEQELVFGNDVGTELVVRLGARVALVPERLFVLGELDTASYELGGDTSYVEGLIGGELALDNGLRITLGGGRGFTQGYGSTALHVVAGVTWAPPRVRPIAPPVVIVDPPPVVVEPPPVVDLDPDADGVPDPADQCPAVAEDKDGHQDEDGCPDGDNDGDGILDTADDCPFDAANQCGVKVNPCEVVIAQTIFFEYDDDAIQPQSHAILDAIAGTLATRPTILEVEIQGHTDVEGDDDYNQRLSDDRARSVRDYLVGKGIAAERLVAKGYGESRPIADNTTAAGRAQNRRVQFIILDPAQDSCADPVTQ